MTNHILVYGTLKKGGHNDYLLAECKLVGIGKVYGCLLINLGPIPGMLPGTVARGDHSDDAIGEVYEIPGEKLFHILSKLDRLENNREWYTRVTMPVDMLSYKGQSTAGANRRVLDCIMYLYMPHVNADSLVSGGGAGTL